MVRAIQNRVAAPALRPASSSRRSSVPTGPVCLRLIHRPRFFVGEVKIAAGIDEGRPGLVTRARLAALQGGEAETAKSGGAGQIFVLSTSCRRKLSALG